VALRAAAQWVVPTSTWPITRAKFVAPVTRARAPRFHATMRGINALRAAGVEFSILAVLTRESLRRVDDVFDFFEAEGIHTVAFNLEEIEGANTAWSFGIGDDSMELYREFARQAFYQAFPWYSGNPRDICYRAASWSLPHNGSRPGEAPAVCYGRYRRRVFDLLSRASRRQISGWHAPRLWKCSER
jgi:sulfatase maturation enzyme AslB (radical SAM superfamily)